jgi:hypothetical protein
VRFVALHLFFAVAVSRISTKNGNENSGLLDSKSLMAANVSYVIPFAQNEKVLPGLSLIKLFNIQIK